MFPFVFYPNDVRRWLPGAHVLPVVTHPDTHQIQRGRQLGWPGFCDRGRQASSASLLHPLPLTASLPGFLPSRIPGAPGNTHLVTADW